MSGMTNEEAANAITKLAEQIADSNNSLTTAEQLNAMILLLIAKILIIR